MYRRMHALIFHVHESVTKGIVLDDQGMEMQMKFAQRRGLE